MPNCGCNNNLDLTDKNTAKCTEQSCSENTDLVQLVIINKSLGDKLTEFETVFDEFQTAMTDFCASETERFTTIRGHIDIIVDNNADCCESINSKLREIVDIVEDINIQEPTTTELPVTTIEPTTTVEVTTTEIPTTTITPTTTEEATTTETPTTTILLLYHMEMSVNDTNYDFINEENIPYNPVSNINTPTKSGYNYLFLSIPTGVSFVITDSLGANVTSDFPAHIESGIDSRIGYYDNTIYRSNSVFATAYSVEYTITLI